MYTIGDFLIQLKNAYKAYKETVEYRYSNAVFNIAKILQKEGFVAKVSLTNDKKKIKIDLKYSQKMPAITDIKLISKPSVHYYKKRTKIGKKLSKNAIEIVSTSKGMMTSKQAQKEGVGGEVICQIY